MDKREIAKQIVEYLKRESADNFERIIKKARRRLLKGLWVNVNAETKVRVQAQTQAAADDAIQAALLRFCQIAKAAEALSEPADPATDFTGYIVRTAALIMYDEGRKYMNKKELHVSIDDTRLQAEDWLEKYVNFNTARKCGRCLFEQLDGDARRVVETALKYNTFRFGPKKTQFNNQEIADRTGFDTKRVSDLVELVKRSWKRCEGCSD